jgi:hypothetical protein
MFNWFNKKKEDQKEIQPVAVKTVAEKKPKKPRIKKVKPAATKVEPRVDVLKFDFDPANPRIGSIELDWNQEFVDLLMSHGYQGATAEDIVDAWLNDVCRTIIANQFPGTAANAATLAAANIVNRKNLGDGKTEFS